VNGEDALEPILVGIGQMLEFANTVGPWVFGVVGLLALVVFVAVSWFILSTWRSINQDHKDMRARMRSGRGLRG